MRAMDLNLIANSVLLVLLFVCMIYDLRDREVPMPLTLGCLVGAGVYALYSGLWSPVLLTIALTHVADFDPQGKTPGFCLYAIGFCRNISTCSCHNLRGDSLFLDFMGILHHGWRRRKASDRHNVNNGEPCNSDPCFSSGWYPGCDCQFAKTKGNPICGFDFLWVAVICSIPANLTKRGGDWLCVF